MWEVHEEVISNLGLPIADSDAGHAPVVNDTDTRMLDITVTSADPQEAADIANEYAQVASQYIAETMATDKPNIMSVALVLQSCQPQSHAQYYNGIFAGRHIGCGYHHSAYALG